VDLTPPASPLFTALRAALPSPERQPGQACASCGKRPADPLRDLIRLARQAGRFGAGELLCYDCRWKARRYDVPDAILTASPGGVFRGRARGQPPKLTQAHARDRGF
jgi:hypothetical protein